MTIYEETISKIRQLPETLILEVNDFVDFLLLKQDTQKQELWRQFTESLELSESDFQDYLTNLEDYEERLAKGEIRW